MIDFRPELSISATSLASIEAHPLPKTHYNVTEKAADDAVHR